jgi:hypothetical protein
MTAVNLQAGLRMTQRHYRRRRAQIAAMLLSLILPASTSVACSISPESRIQQSPRYAFEQAQEVFIATAVSVEMIDEDLARITFQVRAVLKGSQQRLKTFTQNRALGCEFTPAPGLERLFFITPHGDAYSIRHIAGSTKNEVLAELPNPIWHATD